MGESSHNLICTPFLALPVQVSVGTCFGKFTKTKKFRLHITCLDYLAQYAKVRV